jgi:hypothetical protein
MPKALSDLSKSVYNWDIDAMVQLLQQRLRSAKEPCSHFGAGTFDHSRACSAGLEPKISLVFVILLGHTPLIPSHQ